MAELWEVAKRNVGKPPCFESPEEMKEKAFEYFTWLEQNKLIENKAFCSQGEVVYAKIEKMRPATQQGLCVFLNIGVSTWHDYKNKPEYSEVTKLIESVMYEQKFSGASGGLLNANIIARDLGLKDASDVDHKSSDGSMATHSPEDYAKAQAALKNKYEDMD